MSGSKTIAWALLVGAVTLPSPAESQRAELDVVRPLQDVALQDQGLRLAQILAWVDERNPRLQALRSVSVAAQAREAEASTLPDPTLQFGMMNVGLPDLNADMAMTMAPSVQLMQMVPFPGKLGLRGDIAELGTEIADANAQEAAWAVRSRAAHHFYALYALDRRIEVMRSTLGLLRNFGTVAQAMYTAGTGRQADVLRANVEVARMDGEIQTMEAARIAMAAGLNGLLDRAADTPVPTPVLDPMPLELPSADTLMVWAEETRPLLERGKLGVARADTRVDLAHKDIWPNLTFGFSYGQRDRGNGTERMGSAIIGISLPVHAGSRQFAARAEAQAFARVADADLGDMRAQVDARVDQLLAELGRARSLIRLYRGEVLPQATATVESSFSSYRVGTVDFMTLVDAQMTVNRYEGELYQLLADYGAALAALESAVGRPIPMSQQTLTEAS